MLGLTKVPEHLSNLTATLFVPKQAPCPALLQEQLRPGYAAAQDHCPEQEGLQARGWNGDSLGLGQACALAFP